MDEWILIILGKMLMRKYEVKWCFISPPHPT